MLGEVLEKTERPIWNISPGESKACTWRLRMRRRRGNEVGREEREEGVGNEVGYYQRERKVARRSAESPEQRGSRHLKAPLHFNRLNRRLCKEGRKEGEEKPMRG